MYSVLKETKRKFIALVLLSITFVVAVSWGILFVYSNTELSSPAHRSEVHNAGVDNEAYALYLEEQKEYEAHFITLASDIKQQEAERIQRALLVTTIIASVLGIAIAVYTSKKLIKPVEDAYESQERFMQDAAHELRNPLAAMTASLQQASPAIRKTELYITFRRQTKKLIGINEDLLFLERQKSDEITRTNLDELLQDVVEELQPVAKTKNIELVIKSETDIHKTMSQADYVRLVKNIIDNAVKYSRAKSKVIISQTQQKSNITIVVKDSGIGIPSKELENIGERFYRANNTGNVDGTGLGIAIVMKILNLYGGDIQIHSILNKGTTVTVTLPS